MCHEQMKRNDYKEKFHYLNRLGLPVYLVNEQTEVHYICLNQAKTDFDQACFQSIPFISTCNAAAELSSSQA